MWVWLHMFTSRKVPNPSPAAHNGPRIVHTFPGSLVIHTLYRSRIQASLPSLEVMRSLRGGLQKASQRR